jgi:hypothetical protein
MTAPSRPLPHSSHSDVTVNREARLSSQQLFDLLYSGLWRLLIGLPTAGIGAVLAWEIPSGGGDVFAGLGLFAVMFGGVFMLLAGAYVSWRGFSFIGDALTRNVAFVTGPMDRRFQTYRNRKTYYMVVGPVSTRVSPTTYDALPVGVPCHAYYAAGSLHLLSLEPATVEAPHPSLSFGGDAAHAWDRLRTPWLVATVAAFGIAAGLHDAVIAHPARTSVVSGPIAHYYESPGRSGRSTSRFLVLEGSPTQYSIDALSRSSTPPLPDLSSYTGQQADVYVNSDDRREVLALRLGETLYEGELYMHPEHQFWAMVVSGSLVVLLSATLLAVFARRMYRLRRGTPGGQAPGFDVERKA